MSNNGVLAGFVLFISYILNSRLILVLNSNIFGYKGFSAPKFGVPSYAIMKKFHSLSVLIENIPQLIIITVAESAYNHEWNTISTITLIISIIDIAIVLFNGLTWSIVLNNRRQLNQNIEMKLVENES